MKIAAVKISIYNDKDIANPNVSKPTFGAKIDTSYLSQKALSWHKGMIARTNPNDIEKYFEKLGIAATFREGNNYARQFVSYCCYQAAEIFRQINLKLPTKIDLIDFKKIGSDAAGLCNYGSMYNPKYYPVRSTLFNSSVDWMNYPAIQARSNDGKFLSSEYFLHPFVHEYSHSLHFDKLFSKYGCPEPNQGYIYNPNVKILFDKMNLPLVDSQGNKISNPFVHPKTVDLLRNNISIYGGTSLPETFAESSTKQILENTDEFSLRLTKNPFPMNNKDKNIDEVLYELWEGLVGDGKGLV